MPNIYRLEQDLVHPEPMLVSDFRADWLRIEGGIMTVPAGYAWNGCSPRFDVAGLFTVGTPNGRLHHGQPLTRTASCFHDALTQYRGQHGLTRSEANRLFFRDLKRVSFPFALPYFYAVQVFGQRDKWAV